MTGRSTAAPPASGEPRSGAQRLIEPTAPGDRRVWLLVGVLVTVAAAVALRGQRDVLYDDAAIYLRYAQRLATGHGWTYNDGDWTNGASSTLYTVLLAAARWLGVDVEVAARLIGAGGYVASIGLITVLGARLSGVLGGALAGGLLVLSIDFQVQALSGLEGSLATTAALLVLLAVVDRSERRAGLLLGVALLVKLDAALLAVALAAAVVVAEHRLPWRTARVSAAVLGPWLLVSQVLFGSPLPYSATQKASGQLDNPGGGDSVAWMLATLERDGAVLLALAALGAVVVAWRSRRSRPAAATALLTSCLWGLLTLATYSLVDLGDQYPWYQIGLYVPIALGAAVTLTAVVGLVASTARLPARWGPAAGAVVLVTALLAVVLPQTSAERGTSLGTLRGGHVVDAYEAFEATRRDAGRWLGDHAAEGDVVSTCFGWIAVGALQTSIAETCPLNTRDDPGEADWYVLADQTATEPLDADALGFPAELTARGGLVASFFSEQGVGRTDLARLPDPLAEAVGRRLCALALSCAAGGVPARPDGTADGGDGALVPELAAALERARARLPEDGGGQRDATCTAAAVVGAVGQDRLEEREVTVDSLRAGGLGVPLLDLVSTGVDGRRAFLDAWLRCGELDDLVLAESAGYLLTVVQARCVIDAAARLGLLREMVERVLDDGALPASWADEAARPCLAVEP